MSVADHLRRRIHAEGPLSVADVMAAALVHPELGYYTTRDPFGAAGDFVTAPEISQMFGELIGLWAAVVWQGMGAPDPVALVELGPGRGTLMADALRASAGVPAFRAATSVHLVEASPALRRHQATRLQGARPRWHDGLDSLPDQPAIVIANEFFDALPIVQLVRDGRNWRERRMAVAADAEEFVWTLAPGASPHAGLLDPRLRERAPDGALAEVCPAGLSIARTLADRLNRFGGAVLAIDYGHGVSAVGDTLQAVRRHRPADILATLGDADLTAHVDFGALGRAVTEAGAVQHGPVGQGDFLQRLGIEARAEALCRAATTEQGAAVRGACARLIHPDEMGTLFKAVAWTRADAPPPPGFE
ncbi:SAM-dependent methyltransferase [Thalassobaculum sp.]|uniref:class I SAM-dependent methyltransferase n=1 Tax=Thalassobaculum sp. TaxID=2022740 RepID=UPI0032EB0982